MGRWSQARRRGTSHALSAVPQIVSATVDPGGFGATDGVLTVTFDRPLAENLASDLAANLSEVGTFSFGAAPTFAVGSLFATWQSTAFTPGSDPNTFLSWNGTDGPIVFFDASEMGDIENYPVTFI
jgi:hypothetical protein